MKKPDKHLIDLLGIGPIRAVRVDRRQTGIDTCEDILTLTGRDGEVCGESDTYSQYLEWGVWCVTIARLKDEYCKEVLTWIKYEQENKEELELLAKLRAKHG